MTETADYHESRTASERAIASSLPEGEERERHLQLAESHADKAWLVRSDFANGVVDPSVITFMSRRSTDYSLKQAIKQSRELLARSRRLLAENSAELPPRG